MLKIKNDASLKLLSECAFKVKRTRTKVASAESLHYQWVRKDPVDSHNYSKVSPISKTVSTCSHPSITLSIVLHDYCVHLLREVKEALLTFTGRKR